MSTVIFTPSQPLRPVRTTSLDILDLKALIDDHIQTWSNLLRFESPLGSDVGSPFIWSPDGRNVPLLKPAVPKPYNASSDAKVIFTFVEETLREDALEDWQPFTHDGVGRASTITVAAAPETPNVGRAASPAISRRKFLTTSISIPIARSTAHNKLADEATRLSTPLDWKPLHPSDPSFDWRRTDEDSEMSHDYALDDCLISQGDAAKARRKLKKQALEIPQELITRRDTAQVAHLLKSRTVRRFRGGSEGLDLDNPF